MTGDELASLRTLIREEMTSSEQRTRALVREEVNAAVYASEQRMRMFVGDEIKASEQRLNQRLDRFDQRMDGFDQRMDGFDQRLGRFDQRMDGFDRRMDGFGQRLGGIEERLHRAEMLQTQMGANLAKMGTVLEEATTKINELQMGFIALDQKVDGIKRDIQKLIYRADTADAAISGLSLQLKMHRETPINDAHPPSAA